MYTNLDVLIFKKINNGQICFLNIRRQEIKALIYDQEIFAFNQEEKYQFKL